MVIQKKYMYTQKQVIIMLVTAIIAYELFDQLTTIIIQSIK